MRFVVNRDSFNDAVSFAVKLLPQRPTQPILSGILFSTEETAVVFGTFDYETSAKSRVAAEVQVQGTVLVSGRLLSEIASKLPPADVSLELVDDRVVIECGSANFSLPCMPVEEYPELPNIESTSGSISSDDFASAVNQVVVAASKDDVTPVITGVHFEFKAQELVLTATDRYRVATSTIPWKNNALQENSDALVPSRIVSELGKTFSNKDELSIYLQRTDDKELIAFTDGDRTVTSLLIKGNYPPVQRLFPEETANYAVVNTQDIADAVGRVGLVIEREAAIKFSFSDGSVTLEGSGQESARASETADAHLIGDETVVSLKPQFLLDGLRATHSPYAKIAFTKTDNPGKPGPVLITAQTSSDNENDSFKYLLQPNLLLR